MNRLRTTLLPILFAAAILAAGSLGQQAVAQQGHEEHDPFQGVTIEALSSIAPPQLPGYTLVLMRITLELGAEIPAHGHPGAVALTIDSGTFGSEFSHGTGQVTRAASDGGEPQQEQAVPGAELVLEAGDSLAYDGDVVAHTMRNGGSTPVVFLISALLAADQDGFHFQ